MCVIPNSIDNTAFAHRLRITAQSRLYLGSIEPGTLPIGYMRRRCRLGKLRPGVMWFRYATGALWLHTQSVPSVQPRARHKTQGTSARPNEGGVDA